VLGDYRQITRCRRAGDEQLRHTAVRLLPYRQDLRLVGRVAHQVVPEAVPAQPDLGHTLNEGGVLQAGQRDVDVTAGEPAKRLLVELASEGGRYLCHTEIDARRPQPRRQDLVDAGWEHFAGMCGASAAGQLL
jgi:hypothetical protein